MNNHDHILVTGASGFIGRRLVDRLRTDGRAVTVLVRTPDQASVFASLGCRTCVGDLADPDSLRGLGEEISQVFHLAANASLKTRGDDAFAINVGGTRNLLAAIADTPGLDRFVLMSSMAAAARPPGTRLSQPIDETSDDKPDTAYGRSKRAAESLVRSAFAESDTDWVILRPALVYGPGSRRDGGMNALVELARNPGFIGRLDLPGRLSLIHVDDLVDICSRAACGQVPGRRTHFVTDGQPVTFGQVVRTASDILGVDRRLAPVGPLGGIARLVYDRLDAALGISRWVPSYLLAPVGASLSCEPGSLKELGCSPRHTLRSGLTQTLRKAS